MIEVQPPHRLSGHYNSFPSVFLAGSIEMNVAEKWQDRIKRDLNNQDVVLYNPRRDDWDSSIEQKITDPWFSEQVTWELDHLLNADIAAFYLDPNTKSPITLMELGMVAAYKDRDSTDARSKTQSVLVCCPRGFWRRGNVEMVCARSQIYLVDNYEEFVSTLSLWIKRANLPPGHR